MDFGGIDLARLLGQQGASSNPYSTPPIKSNQEPLQNSWGADGSFKLGFPPTSAPRPIAPPPSAGGQRQPVPPTVGIGGGAAQPTTGQNPFVQPAQPQPAQNLPDYEQYLRDNPGVRQYYENNAESFGRVGNDWKRAAEQHYDLFGRDEGRPWGVQPIEAPRPIQVPIKNPFLGAPEPMSENGTLTTAPNAPGRASPSLVERMMPHNPFNVTLAPTAATGGDKYGKRVTQGYGKNPFL